MADISCKHRVSKPGAVAAKYGRVRPMTWRLMRFDNDASLGIDMFPYNFFDGKKSANRRERGAHRDFLNGKKLFL
jgi:hypothetical protein